MKEKLYEFIEKSKDELFEISDYIFDNPEVGLEEYKASERLCKYLEDNGFNVQKGICGLDTAFKAVYEQGTGGPSFGLLTEYDALEGLGHACGHHAQAPSIIGAALALKDMKTEKTV